MAAPVRRSFSLSQGSMEIATAKIRDPKTKEWKVVQLDALTKEKVVKALDVIKNHAKVSEFLKAEGTILELTEDKIFAKKLEGGFVELTADLALLSPTKRLIRNALNDVKKIVNEQKGEVSIPLKEIGLEKFSKEMIIEIQVVPNEQTLKEEIHACYQVESERLRVIDDMRALLSSPDWKEKLGEVNYSEIENSLSNLSEAETRVLESFSRVDGLLQQGEFPEAIEEYNKLIPGVVKEYLSRLREWEIGKQTLRAVLGSDSEKNPFQKGLNQSFFLLADVGNFFEVFVQKKRPELANETMSAFQTVEQLLSNYVENDAFYSAHSIEHVFTEKIGMLLPKLGLWKEKLQEKGLTDEEAAYFIESAKQRLETIFDAQFKIEEIMTNTSLYLQGGKKELAVSEYLKMAAVYGEFCEALRSWLPMQKLFTDYFGSQHPFQIESFRFDFQKNISKLFFDKMNASIPDLNKRETVTESLKQINLHAENFLNSTKLNNIIKAEFIKFHNNELNFNRSVVNAFSSFEDQEFIGNLKSSGFTDEEIQDHKEKIKTAMTRAAEFQAILKETSELISWDVEEGFNYYSSEMDKFMPLYQQALADLVMPQRVAANRLANQPAFSLELDRLKNTTQFIEAIEKKRSELNVTKNLGRDPYIDFPGYLKKVKAHSEVFIKAATYKPLSDALNKIGNGLKMDLLKSMGDFVTIFQSHREQFEAIMREEGFTDLQTAAMFNHYVLTYESFQSWLFGIQEAMDLGNKKDYQGALDRYCQLVEHEFIRLNDRIFNFLPFVHKFDARINNALDRFCKTRGIQDSQQIFYILQIIRYTTNLTMQMRGEIKGNLIPSDLQETEKFKEVYNLMQTQTDKNNLLVDEKTRLTKIGNRFQDFSKLSEEKSFDADWKTKLNEQRWPARWEHFDRIANEYASHIEMFQQGEQAVALEQDPIKKRALRSQLIQLGLRYAPEIKRLQKDLQLAGGIERIQSLITLSEEFYSGLDVSNQESYNPIKKEAVALAKLLEDRVSYVDNFYRLHHLSIPYEKNQVQHLLLKGPHSKDPEFQKILNDAKWTQGAIQSFNEWYDPFHLTTNSLQMAKAQLEQDPENILLQRQFEKIFKQQFPKINQLNDEFKAKFGLQKVKDLVSACAKYQSLIKSEKIKIENSRTMEQQGKNDAEKLKNYEQSLLVMETIDFDKEIERIDSFWNATVEFANQPKSWDKHYLDSLVDTKKSLLAKNLNVERMDLKEIIHLFQKYQSALKKMNELERKVEAVPESSSFRSSLRKEIESSRKTLKKLDQEYEKLSDKIVNLHTAVKDKGVEFSTKLKNIMDQEQIIQENNEKIEGSDNPIEKKQFFDTAHFAFQNVDRMRKEAGNLSNAEMQSLIQQCEDLNILAVFSEKRNFFNETSRRYG